jgi:L-ascorbate metabolism protein UlaG (beta-lactamase superfamily)
MATAARSIRALREHHLPGTDAQPGGVLVKVTFSGTAALLVDDGGTQIFIDAFITWPTMKTLLASLNSGKALIQTGPAVVDGWLARPEAGQIAAMFVARSHHDHAIDVAHIANHTDAQVLGSESALNIA